MAESRPPPGSSSRDDRSPADGRLRVLVIRSYIAPLEAILDAFPARRFEANFAHDALTVLASVSAREADVVVLDTPLFEVDIDTLLWKLEQQQSRVPVLILGDSPPPQPMRLQFIVRYLPKPLAVQRLREEVEAVVREAGRGASLPPSRRVREEAVAADFLEWSQLTAELTEEEAAAEPTLEEGAAPPEPVDETVETVEIPGAELAAAAVRTAQADATVDVAPAESVAAAAQREQVERTVEVEGAALADAAARMESAEETIETDGPAGVPEPPVPARPPRRPARGVDLERTLTLDGPDAAPPPLAGRSAAIVGRRVEVATRVSLALYAAGLEVRILEGGLADVLPQLRGEPPDLVVVELAERDEVEPTLREFRAEVRLWHRPLLVVAASAELEALLRTSVPGGPDAVVQADAAEAELIAKAGFLLAPVEQLRERMRGGKAVSGELGPIGVVTLVRLAAAARPEGRLVLRGEGRLAELELRGSELVQVRLTEPDGRQLEGEAALAVALTMRAGRYSFRPPPVARSGASLHLPIPQALWDVADRLGSLIRRLAPERLPRIRRLRLRDRSGPLRGLASAELRARERFQAGDAPRVLFGAPGLGPEAVARLVEKLVLSGDVVDVEEDEGEAAPAAELEDATLELLDAVAAEELPAVAPPPRPPSAVRTLFGIPPPGVAGRAVPPPESGPPPPESPRVESFPPPESPRVDSFPPPLPASPPPAAFGVLPTDVSPVGVAGPPLPEWPVPLPDSAAPGPVVGRRARSVAAWLVPAALLLLGVGVLGVLFATGRLGGGGSGGPVDVAGRVDATSGGSGVAGVESAGVEAGRPAMAAPVPEVDGPDVTAPAPEADGPDAAAPVPEASGPDVAFGVDTGVESAADPEASAAIEVATPEASGPAPEPAGRPDGSVDAAVLPDRRGAASRDAGVPRHGPAVLVVPRPEGVSVELVVFVDGVRRGSAPLRVELPAGAHELRFEAAGRQSLSIVRLRAGERKTVVPRQLLRQLQSP